MLRHDRWLFFFARCCHEEPRSQPPTAEEAVKILSGFKSSLATSIDLASNVSSSPVVCFH